MNILTDSRMALRERRWAAPFGTLPRYVSFMLMVALVVALIMSGGLLSVRQIEISPNPFADYTDIMPGVSRDMVLDRQFSCQQTHQAGEAEICSQIPSAGPFLFVAVTLFDDIVRRVTFSVRSNTLTVGDLVLTWGLPNIRLYGQSASFEWNSIAISATGWSQTEHFDYRIPLWNITFTSPTLPIVPNAKPPFFGAIGA